jgi:hypothetical protein
MLTKNSYLNSSCLPIFFFCPCHRFVSTDLTTRIDIKHINDIHVSTVFRSMTQDKEDKL